MSVSLSARKPVASSPVTPEAPSWRTIAAAYYSLTKPHIMVLLLITTLAAILIAAREHPLPAFDFVKVLVVTMIGGALSSGGAAALNCYIDRDIDAVMKRTRGRAIPSGVLTPRQVLYFGLTLTVVATLLLLLFVNVAAAALALFGSFYYVVIYTMLLKRSTAQNIVIGGGAGAVPPLVGWAAVTGGVALPPLVLFAIVVLWTPAHFWSLALMTRTDYAAVGVPMMPVVVGEKGTKQRIVLYTLLVIACSVVLYILGAMGQIYLGAALALGAGFLFMSLRLLREEGHTHARATFMYSNIYLAFLFAAMVVDRVVGL